MTSRARLAALLAPLLLLAPGCGTLLTARAGSHRSFSGCQADLAVISAPFVLGAADPTFLTGLPFCLAAGLVDLPLSFVGDLCMLVGHAADRDEPATSSKTVAPAPPPTGADEVAVALATSEPPSLALEVGTTR
jgi:hypothetical protein